jgi:hypothetical protein
MRKDMIGNLYFKYSDDCARSWSTKRHLIPYRVTQIDRMEGDGGATHSAWMVGASETVGSNVYVTLAKSSTSNKFEYTEG